MRVDGPQDICPSWSDFSPVWDSKPDRKDDPTHWVELKTSHQLSHDRSIVKFERKLLKFWAQSFLLGVPKIIVGFRNMDGILQSLQELETQNIPRDVKRKGKSTWDGNVCINFAASFLECTRNPSPLSCNRRTILRSIDDAFRARDQGHHHR